MSHDQGKKKTKTELKPISPAKEEQTIRSTDLTDSELGQISGGITAQDLTAFKRISASSPPTIEEVLRINTILKNKAVS